MMEKILNSFLLHPAGSQMLWLHFRPAVLLLFFLNLGSEEKIFRCLHGDDNEIAYLGVPAKRTTRSGVSWMAVKAGRISLSEAPCQHRKKNFRYMLSIHPVSQFAPVQSYDILLLKKQSSFFKGYALETLKIKGSFWVSGSKTPKVSHHEASLTTVFSFCCWGDIGELVDCF